LFFARSMNLEIAPIRWAEYPTAYFACEILVVKIYRLCRVVVVVG
jgi:hypothetical protein